VASTVKSLAAPSWRIAPTPSSIEAWRKAVVRVNTNTETVSRACPTGGAGVGP
jgi:hypothetical protein